MERTGLKPEEREAVKEWAGDERWVKREAWKADEAYMACVRDIMEHPVFLSMDGYYQHGRTTCREHCIRVSYLSYRLCRKYGWDYRSVARAALLHDLFLYDWHTHARETGDHFHGFTHPRVAMKNAERYFQATEKERNMILCHMWPLTLIPPRYKEGYAIVWADKFCSLAEVGSGVREWFINNLGPALTGR